tara:strand:+ start:354 stop:986 length:633 start_codon:yes stop_codon:yes gene_type:complete
MPKRSQPARDDVEIGEPQVVSAGRPVANTPSWLVLVLLINIAATAAGVWFGITELISLRATVEEQQRKYDTAIQGHVTALQQLDRSQQELKKMFGSKTATGNGQYTKDEPDEEEREGGKKRGKKRGRKKKGKQDDDEDEDEDEEKDKVKEKEKVKEEEPAKSEEKKEVVKEKDDSKEKSEDGKDDEDEDDEAGEGKKKRRRRRRRGKGRR